MSQSYDYDYDHQYGYADGFAADAAVAERVAFIRRTYGHLFGAILAFIGLVTFFLGTPAITGFMVNLFFGMQWGMLIVLGLFIVVSMVAQKWAASDTSLGVQYAGLALFTVAEALIFVPLLFIAELYGGAGVIETAGILTLLIFSGLTVFVLLTKQDFSFLRSALALGGLAAFGLIIAGLLFGFTLGIVFIVFMIVLMSGYILYDTSNVLHHYRTTQHVAASLALFASVATLFWYVIQLVMMLGGDD